MKVSELTGALLDYWVAKAEGFQCSQNYSTLLQKVLVMALDVNGEAWFPSERWGHGGPIIEQKHIAIEWDELQCKWHAELEHAALASGQQRSFAMGDTALEAAMRAFVASEYGDTVPDDPQGR